jgi:hypothetical protein
MLKIPHTKELLNVAQRLVWFKQPQDALDLPYTFMAHVMTYGTITDVITVKKALGLNAFKEALDHMPPGIIDAKSWNYWHIITNKIPTPPLPTRKFF